MPVVLLPSSLLEISNLCLRGMSLFPGEAVNAALSAGDGKGGITAWQSIASTKTVATRSWQITISGIKPCPSRPWGYSPKCCPSTMAGSSQRKVFRRSAREGPDAVLAALRELEDAGYLVRHQSRDEKGRMSSMVFEIYEKPQTGLPDTEKPHTEKPDTDNPFTGKPCTENPAQLNTNQVITNERNNSLRNYQSINLDGWTGWMNGSNTGIDPG